MTGDLVSGKGFPLGGLSSPKAGDVSVVMAGLQPGGRGRAAAPGHSAHAGVRSGPGPLSGSSDGP